MPSVSTLPTVSQSAKPISTSAFKNPVKLDLSGYLFKKSAPIGNYSVTPEEFSLISEQMNENAKKKFFTREMGTNYVEKKQQSALLRENLKTIKEMTRSQKENQPPRISDTLQAQFEKIKKNRFKKISQSRIKPEAHVMDKIASKAPIMGECPYISNRPKRKTLSRIFP